jgi:hypothetical protein
MGHVEYRRDPKVFKPIAATSVAIPSGFGSALGRINFYSPVIFSSGDHCSGEFDRAFVDYSFLSDAMSIEKRYFTSDLSILSYASLTF